MKKLIIIATFLLTGNVFGQQLPQYTQYMFNQYAFNPAYAGVKDNWEAISDNRYQWLGITDAPRTFTLSAAGPLKGNKLAMGGYVYTDVVGPTRRLGFQSSIGYHLQVSETIKLSFGLSLGFNQWLLDADKITTVHEDDYYFSNGLLRSFDPDGKFGLYLYHDDWYVGASIEQIFRDKLSFSTALTGSESYLEQHYYFNAGYNWQVSEDWEIQPTTLLKVRLPAPPKLDFTLRATYKKMLWVGAGYRTNDAWTAMVGFRYRDMLQIGYSYDITNTDLKNYNSGTHEVLMGITFGNSKKDR